MVHTGSISCVCQQNEMSFSLASLTSNQAHFVLQAQETHVTSNAHVHFLLPSVSRQQCQCLAINNLDFQTRKAVFPWLERLQQLLHEGFVVTFSQNVDHELAASVQQILYCPILLNSHSQPGWIKTGLPMQKRDVASSGLIILVLTWNAVWTHQCTFWM